MIRILAGIFLILHGLVHLLYFGQSARYFELQPGMTWPDGSWAFSRLFSAGGTRTLASVLLILAALGFVASGLGLFLKQPWWQPVIMSAAGFSSLIYLLLWDGRVQSLADKGGVGILINLVILVALLIFQWPDIKF